MSATKLDSGFVGNVIVEEQPVMTTADMLAEAKARTDHVHGIVPTMLKCVWPRTSTVTTHAAIFAAQPDPSLRPLDHSRDGFASVAPLAIPAPFVPPTKPVAEPPVESPLISKNGKRLPLAAFSYRELDRRFWSQGKTLYSTERNRALELQAHDKQPADMTFEELEATQEREILSESRRSWLELGIKTMSLAPQSDEDDGSIENTIEAPGADMDDLDNAEWDDVRYSHAFGTAMVQIDPITLKQIDWEKRVRLDGQLRALKIVDGKIRLVPPTKRTPVVPYTSMDEFMRTANRVKGLLLDHRALKPALSEERIKDLGKRFDAYIDSQIENLTMELPKEDHGHWLDSAGMLHFHGIHRLSLEEQRFGPYHAVPQDRTELGINSVDSDEYAEDLMGTEPCAHCDDGLIALPQPLDDWNDPVCTDCALPRTPSMRLLAGAA